MLHLTTGANGTRKTLFNLKWVRERQLKENRPVYYNGRFKLKPEIEAEFGWQKFNFEDWQSLPDGSICFVDECHNDLPRRNPNSKPPEHVAMLAEHRARGFDFYLITQHPKNIDPFVTRLIGSPGWHRHLVRLAGATPIVNQLHWEQVYANPENINAKASSDATKRKFPKEVYNWYDSAVMHTGKVRIPAKLILFVILVAIVIPGLAWYAMSSLLPDDTPAPKTAATAAQNAPTAATPPATPPNAPGQVLTASQYLETYRPRIPDFPHSAPRYDPLTQPKDAPYPAVCISTKQRCQCYTQQSTKLNTTDAACRDIAKNGFFRDWAEPAQPQQNQQQNQPRNHEAMT